MDGPATVAAQHARGRCPGGGRLAGERGPKPDGGDGEGGGGGRAARLEDRAEVDGQRGVGERGGPPPGVQAREGAAVGASGVDADRGVGELPGGRRGDGPAAPACRGVGRARPGPCFCRQVKAKNSQANGLYVLVGLYLLDLYVLVCGTCYPDSLA